MSASFEALIAEAEDAPIGWDFSWLEGRATEERPSWHYSELVANTIERSSAMLDLQSGAGEMLDSLPRFPKSPGRRGRGSQTRWSGQGTE